MKSVASVLAGALVFLCAAGARGQFEKIIPGPLVLERPQSPDEEQPVENLGGEFPGDSCATATVITEPPFTSSWEFSFAAPGTPPGSCNDAGATQMRNDGWFTHTAPVDGLLRVTTTGFSVGGGGGGIQAFIVVVYRGIGCSMLAEVACADHSGDGGGGGGVPLVVETPVSAGEQVWIQSGRFGVGGSGGGGAGLHQTIELLAVNDECAGAIELTAGKPVLADTRLASTSGSDPLFACAAGGPVQGFGTLWYSFVAQSEGAGLSTCQTSGGLTGADSLLAVYSGDCGSLAQIACNDTGGCYPTSGYASLNVTGLTPGATYYVEVAARTTAALREYRLDVIHFLPCPPGALIEPESCVEDVNGGCNEPGTPTTPIALDQVVCGQFRTEPCCGTGLQLNLDWYEFEVVTTTTVSCCLRAQSRPDFKLVLSQPPCPATVVASADQQPPGGIECITVTLSPGLYLIVPTLHSPLFISTIVTCGQGNDYQFSVRTAPMCPGDANGDGVVSFADITSVLTNFGALYAPGTGPGDASIDGVVSFADVTSVLTNFGADCP